MACGECPAWGYVDQPSLIELFHNALPGSSATSLGHRCPPSAYLLLRIIKTGEQRLWLWFAVRYGIGLENKYSMAVFGFAEHWHRVLVLQPDSVPFCRTLPQPLPYA